MGYVDFPKLDRCGARLSAIEKIQLTEDCCSDHSDRLSIQRSS